MRINVYKSYTGKEFNSYEFDAKDGKTVGELFSEIDYENSLVFCNGNEINERYVPKDGDIVTIRTMPSSVSSLIVAGVVLAAFGIAEGISYGVTGKGLFKNLAEYLMPDVPTPKNSEQSQTETLPSLKGAKNQRAFGKPIPLVIGQSRLTPYLVGSYHTITGNDGENQRFHALYVLGYNDISAGAFKIGEQDLAANGMTEKYSSGNYSLEIGESNKKKGSITDFNELTPFSSANPVLEISNSGELDAYRQKVTEEAIGRQIINANGTPLVFERASDQHPRTIQVEISFNSLFAYDSSGGMVDAEAKIGIAISYNGGKTYEPFNPIQGNNGYENVAFDRGTICVSTIRRAKNRTLRFIAQRVIPPDRAREIESANGYAWVIVQRMDKDSTDSKTSNKAYLSYIRTYVYDKTASFDELGNLRHPDYLVPQVPIIQKLRDKTTRVAFEIDATDNVSGTLDELNCMVVANCRTFSGGKWSEGKSPTSNPAANALSLMQSACLGSNAYGDDKIDLYAFGEMYEFCESKGFSVGGVLTSQKKLSDVIDLILRNARSYRIVSGRKYSVFVDKPASVPACVLNNSNLLAGEVSNTKNFDTLPDGFKISFVNKNLGYDEDEVYVMFDEGKSPDDPNTVIESVDMPFVTDPRQIAKNAWFEYAKRKLRPETWTRTVSTEANLIEIGSLVELQDDTIQVGIGNGGYIRSLIVENGLIKGFVSTDKVNIYDVAKEYGVKITHSSETDNVNISVRKLAVSEPFYSDTFHFDTPIAESAPNAPDIGDLVSFGEYGKETISCLCINKKDKGDGKFALELLPYDSRVYDADNNANLEFDSKVSTVQKNVVQSTNDYVTREQLMERENAIINGIDKNSDPPDTPIVEQCKAYRDYVSMNFGELPDGTRNELKEVEWQVNKGTAWETFSVGLSFYARCEFARETDGYPEAEDLDWQFRCRVTNIAGKKSDWSDPVTADVSGYGTWLAPSTKEVAAKAEYGGDGIRVRFKTARADYSRAYYGRVEYDIDIKYDGTTIRTEHALSEYFSYHFDRETDGYPERHENASDGIRDLSLYSFTVTPVDTVTGRKGGAATSAHIDDSEYGTWLIPEASATATAGEHRISLSWTLASRDNIYGNITYDIYLDGNAITEGTSRIGLVYPFHENLEREDLEKLSFAVRARNEAHERTAKFVVDVSGYLGYKIGKPEITAKAVKDGIEVSWRKTNDFYGKCEYVLLKDGGEVFSSARETERFLPFGEDEFPEKSDIAQIDIRVRIDGDEESATSDVAEIDASGYLTYVPSVPTVYPSASGRNANLSWDAQGGVYGFLGCEIQIAKAYKTAGGKCEPIVDDSELEWFAPALGLNPYESLDNYKKGEAGGRLEVRGTSVSFSLPLFGQDADGAADTQYAFRLRGKSAAGKVSDWTEALYLTCRAVSAHDVVRAWDLGDGGEKVRLDGALGARQIFVEELAAISANLGYITDGALRGNAYNYWAVGDTPMDDGSTLWRGSFRVGGKDQYILVEPRLGDSGVPTGEYDITFVVGNYSVSASGTQIRGGAFEVYDTDGNLMFGCSPDGSRIRVDTGMYMSRESRVDVPTSFYYNAPIFLTVKDGGDAYVVFPSIVASGEDYEADVYRVGASSYERVWTWTGSLAQSLFTEVPYFNYALADADGKFAMWGIDRETNAQGVYVVDMRGRSATFVVVQDLNVNVEDQFGGYSPFKLISVSEQVFFMCEKEEKVGSNYVKYRNVFVMSEDGLAEILPNGGGNYDLLGVAVHGGFAYAAFQSFIFTIVIRRDLATGEMSAFMFAGAVNSEYENSGIFNNALMVDGESVTLFGRVTLFEDESTTTGEFIGAVRVPLAEARWFPSVDEITENTTGIKAYRYADVLGDESLIAFVTPFALEGELLAANMLQTENKISFEASRLEFADTETPAPLFNGTMAGALAPTLVESFEILDFRNYEKLYIIYSYFGVDNCVAFPQLVGDVDTVRCAYPRVDVTGDEVEFRGVSVRTVLHREVSVTTGSGVYSAGIGFCSILHDRMSGKYRYYLDTGAYVEFNEDGTLTAQTGAAGAPGRDGADGKDGEPGQDGTTPEISVSATVDGGTGEPDVDVTKSGDEAHQSFALAFRNLKGEKGERGEKGEKGEQGERGATGATGAQGPKGDKGDTGPQGPVGNLQGAALSSSNPISNTNPGRLAAGKMSIHTSYNAGGPATYGNLVNIGGSGGAQMFFEWSGNQSSVGGAGCGRVFYRSWRDIMAGWTAWEQVGGRIPTSQPASLQDGMIWLA